MAENSPKQEIDRAVQKGLLSQGLDVPSMKYVSLAENKDVPLVLEKLQPLLKGKGESQHQRWQMCCDGKGIRRSFHFKTFKQTWAFMDAVATKCKEERHHPEWWNTYNHTFIQWTTHRPDGLTIKDVNMAAFCDDEATSNAELEGKDPTTKNLFGLVEAEL